MSLETGASDYFWPAHRLYAKAGFDECEPFGSYTDDPHSLFFTMQLLAAPRAAEPPALDLPR
ncbi:hypothetical protein ACFVAE_16995 [Microbacterium sp. NPDC057659]|uniref:hypothetical protein n=1 Tax=Microbacterium sp. NPDC057659 TaxID=3346198 RepID=UPI00367038AA